MSKLLALLAPYRKLAVHVLYVLVAVATAILSIGVLPASIAVWVTAGVGIVSALGLWKAPNEPGVVPVGEAPAHTPDEIMNLLPHDAPKILATVIKDTYAAYAEVPKVEAAVQNVEAVVPDLGSLVANGG